MVNSETAYYDLRDAYENVLELLKDLQEDLLENEYSESGFIRPRIAHIIDHGEEKLLILNSNAPF